MSIQFGSDPFLFDTSSASCNKHPISDDPYLFTPSANVLLTEDWRGKLGDFGLARLLPSESEQQHSEVHTATIVGTCVYMAPETARGVVTIAADVYALGVVSLASSAPHVTTPTTSYLTLSV